MGIKVACIMMQKDELILFDAWINYYSHLFLPSNLYVFDNGSTHHLMADKLLDAEHKGVHVYKEYDTKTDFMAKGEIFADLIRHLDSSDPYDFIFHLIVMSLLLWKQMAKDPARERLSSKSYTAIRM